MLLVMGFDTHRRRNCPPGEPTNRHGLVFCWEASELKVLLLYLLEVYTTTIMPTAHEIIVFFCVCFTSLQQRGHLETAPPFTVPWEGHACQNAQKDTHICGKIVVRILTHVALRLTSHLFEFYAMPAKFLTVCGQWYQLLALFRNDVGNIYFQGSDNKYFKRLCFNGLGKRQDS